MQCFHRGKIVIIAGLKYDILDVQVAKGIGQLVRLDYVFLEPVLDIDGDIAEQQLVESDDPEIRASGISAHCVDKGAVARSPEGDIGFRRCHLRHRFGRLSHPGNERYIARNQRHRQYRSRKCQTNREAKAQPG